MFGNPNPPPATTTEITARNRHLAILFAGLLAGSSTLVGCSDSSEPEDAATATATADPQATDSTDASQGDATGLPLTAKTAIDAALAAVPGGTAVAGGLTDEAGQEVWYIEVRDAQGSGTEVYLATTTGEVVRQRAVSLSSVASGQPPALTAQEGIAAAIQAVPDSEVLEFDLETERGVTAWYVLLRDSAGTVGVYVNADTGAIISQDRDD